jgi:hypothetical protein
MRLRLIPIVRFEGVNITLGVLAAHSKALVPGDHI